MAVTARVGMGLCALETSLSPPTVLRKRGAAHLGAPVRLRCGCGAAHGHHEGLSRPLQEREHVSTHPQRGRAKRLCAHERASTHEGPRGRAHSPGGAHDAPVRPQAHLLRALRHGARCRDCTLPHVLTGHTPHGLMEGRGPATPGLCQAFSPRGGDPAGPQDWRANILRPLPRRPT